MEIIILKWIMIEKKDLGKNYFLKKLNIFASILNYGTNFYSIYNHKTIFLEGKSVFWEEYFSKLVPKQYILLSFF